VILGNAFGVDEGIVVDTHVKRLADRLGFTRETDPVKVERDLMALFPRDRWTLLSHLLIWHGRRVCDARKPRCEACVVSHLCPSSRV
jgi:endonuclease-3